MPQTIEVLSPLGHILLTWDPTITESIERARSEFAALVSAGYQFFRVENPAQEASFSSEVGALVVKRVDADEVAPSPVVSPRVRRGRKSSTERIVATRPMRGG